MSTLPPTPSFNPNIPIVTPGGGTSAAYKNPNSPESILKNLTTLQVQASVDQKFDVAQSAYHEEKFTNFAYTKNPSDMIRILLGCIIVLFIALVSFKTLPFSAKTFLLFIAVVLTLLVIHLYVRNVND